MKIQLTNDIEIVYYYNIKNSIIIIDKDNNFKK